MYLTDRYGTLRPLVYRNIGKEELNHGYAKTKAQRLFRQDRLCAVGRRRFGRSGQHLAVSVPRREIRRRHFSAGVHRAGRHLWLHDDRGRNGTGPHDPQKPGGCLWRLWQKGRPAVRRLDQCGHPYSDRAVLFGHWWMGHPLSVGVYQRHGSEPFAGRLFFPISFPADCRQRCAF